MVFEFRKFLDHMRQTGSTTALIKITKETGGYLVVGNRDIKSRILKNHPCLANQIFSIYEVARGHCSGLTPKPIFIDTDVTWNLTTVINSLNSDIKELVSVLQEYKNKLTLSIDKVNNFMC